MALEAVVCSSYNSSGVGGVYGSSPWSYDFGNYYSSNSLSDLIHDHHNNNDMNNNQWDQEQQQQQQQQFIKSSYSSPEGNEYCSMEQQQYDLPQEAPPAALADSCGGGRRKRRRRSKNKEEVEQQRMTHIAVERNRRKQMNDYLAVIRSLMPPSYSQRGDQASIVAGAINYVKELEQLLQSLQAGKRSKQDLLSNNSEKKTGSGSSSSDHHHQPQSLFGEFFNFPQYSSQATSSCGNSVSANEIEVTMVDGHANVRILAKKQQNQLLRLVAAFQGLLLSVLHLNVTTLDPFVLYSFNLKAEEGCHLTSVDDVAAAANHILAQIQEEAAALFNRNGS